VSQGRGKIRWEDNKDKVRELYANAKPSAAYEGRDPRTGERVLVPAGLVVADFLEVSPRVSLEALVLFDASGIKELSLSPTPISATENWNDPEWSAWSENIKNMAVELGHRLGFATVSRERFGEA